MFQQEPTSETGHEFQTTDEIIIAIIKSGSENRLISVSVGETDRVTRTVSHRYSTKNSTILSNIPATTANWEARRDGATKSNKPWKMSKENIEESPLLSRETRRLTCEMLFCSSNNSWIVSCSLYVIAPDKRDTTNPIIRSVELLIVTAYASTAAGQNHISSRACANALKLAIFILSSKHSSTHKPPTESLVTSTNTSKRIQSSLPQETPR